MRRILSLALLAAVAALPVQAQSPFSPGLRSVKIEADDFDKTVRFYTALGMKPGVRRDETWDLVWEGASQNSGVLITSAAYARRAKMVRGGTYLMIMTDDVAAAVDRLRKAGFANVGEPRQMGTMASVLMLDDPDGNRIELMGPPVR